MRMKLSLISTNSTIKVEFKSGITDEEGFQTLVTIGRLLKREETDIDVIRTLLQKEVSNLDTVVEGIRLCGTNHIKSITVDCDEWSYVAGFTLNK